MKWKCKLTGNIIDLPDWEEENMSGHDQYEKVTAESTEEEPEFKSKLSYPAERKLEDPSRRKPRKAEE